VRYKLCRASRGTIDRRPSLVADERNNRIQEDEKGRRGRKGTAGVAGWRSQPSCKFHAARTKESRGIASRSIGSGKGGGGEESKPGCLAPAGRDLPRGGGLNPGGRVNYESFFTATDRAPSGGGGGGGGKGHNRKVSRPRGRLYPRGPAKTPGTR